MPLIYPPTATRIYYKTDVPIHVSLNPPGTETNAANFRNVDTENHHMVTHVWRFTYEENPCCVVVYVKKPRKINWGLRDARDLYLHILANWQEACESFRPQYMPTPEGFPEFSFQFELLYNGQPPDKDF